VNLSKEVLVRFTHPAQSASNGVVCYGPRPEPVTMRDSFEHRLDESHVAGGSSVCFPGVCTLMNRGRAETGVH
jgi:hypothetical protein